MLQLAYRWKGALVTWSAGVPATNKEECGVCVGDRQKEFGQPHQLVQENHDMPRPSFEPMIGAVWARNSKREAVLKSRHSSSSELLTSSPEQLYRYKTRDVSLTQTFLLFSSALLSINSPSQFSSIYHRIPAR